MADYPDFLVIGAARAGTTALHGYLRQHPQVFMPSLKEPNFFAFEGQTLACSGPGADYINNSLTDFDTYRKLFNPAPKGAICGEASPLYLFADQAPARIKHHAPKARMIVVLRNPIEQAYSHFLYATKQSIEPEPDFTKALDLETERLNSGWQPLFGYSSFPLYAQQLTRYFEHFPRDQFFICAYEDFQQSADKTLAQMFEFIGADAGFQVDMSHRPNAGGVPKNRVLQDFLMKSNPLTRAIGYVVPQNARLAIRDRIAAVNMRREITMPPKAREILTDRLGDEIRALEKLIDRDLSSWISAP